MTTEQIIETIQSLPIATQKSILAGTGFNPIDVRTIKQAKDFTDNAYLIKEKLFNQMWSERA